jgi:ligand-binding sensor domain-containing protein/signal transduction histidine kinase
MRKVPILHRAFILTLACLLVGNSIVLALDPAKSPTQYVHNVWQADDGLPQNYVVAIAQTLDGYVWLATQEGLARFDGVKFTSFDSRNTEGIKENNILALLADSGGGLWFGSEGGGLSLLKDGKLINYTTKDGLCSNVVESICEDHDGGVWIGTDAGLNRFKNGRFDKFPTSADQPGESIICVFEDREDTLWLGTDGGGLIALKGRQLTGNTSRYTRDDGLANDLVRAIYEDSSGQLWIGTRDGLSKFQHGKFTTYSTEQGLANSGVLSICEDRDRNLWIGTDGGGLNRLKDDKVTVYSKAEGLSDDSVAAIFEDREGNLWIGTYGGGLNRLKDGRFTVYDEGMGLSNDTARSIIQDRAGDVWIATRNGLNRLRDGKFTIYTSKQGLANDSVLSLFQDKQGDLWAGTRGGLSRFHGGKFTSYTTMDGLCDDTVLSIAQDQAGVLWVGTAAGINRLVEGKLLAYRAGDGLTNDSVWSMLPGPDGSMWIGTDGGGLNQWKDGKFHSYTKADGLANDIVLSMYLDGDSNLWIGTSGGLSRMKDGRFTSYTRREGLFDDVIFQILEDDGQNLWMSCNKGIFRVNKMDFDALDSGRARSVDSISYGTADGMKSRECDGGFQPAGWKTMDGNLWFPTTRGVVTIAPNKIRINELPPPVIIEQFLADGLPVDQAAAAKLSPGTEKFEFHFTGLSLIAPEKVRFKYKLDGYDKDWVDGAGRRDASYTHLPAGNYTFRVMACNNDGVWNEAGASFSIYLKPFFYRTIWFYGLLLMLAGLAALAIYRYRVRQIRRQFAAILGERSRLAREIHDMLSQGFVAIDLQLDAASGKLAHSPESARGHLELAHKLIRNSLAEARRSVWDLRPQALETGGLAAALKQMANETASGTDISVDFQLNGPSKRLRPDLEHNFLRVAQEAMTNAIKHAAPRNITLELRFQNGLVALSVRDDGRGFDTTRPFSPNNGHFGLAGMRERAEQLGGSLAVTSHPGEGTSVEITAQVG